MSTGDLYVPKTHEDNGGDDFVVESGGRIVVKTGGSIVPDSETQASNIPALTDSTTGTAGDTIAAIPDPADTPADADALRDDLVANTIPALRDAIASLAAKVNDLTAALEGVGITAAS